MNGGRFLIKVSYSYDPNNTGASYLMTNKYIRIDSIGRIGVINAQDPTTYTTSPPDARRKELTAYKPIGIVDYSRFITNKDNRTDTASLGDPSIVIGAPDNPTVVTPGVEDITPGSPPTADPYSPTEYPLVTTYGSPTGYTTPASPNLIGGGSLRSNMNLRLYGINSVYLNTNYGDDWEIAGNLTFDQYNTQTANGDSATVAGTYITSLPAQLYVNTPTMAIPAANGYGSAVFPSNDPNFSTFSGSIRDGNVGSDSNGYPRQIKRLNPPLVDTVDPVTHLTRYQSLTASSEVQTQQSGTTVDYSPATVNVDNDADIQHESLNSVPGRSLRNDWVNHASDTGGSWEGSYYNPPGTLITFGPVTGFPASTPTQGLNTAPGPYGITLVRSDGAQWTSGQTQIGETLSLTYDAPPNTTDANPTTGALGYLDVNQPDAPNDVVIHATGNVRIRGLISDPGTNSTPKHITIVTDGIAYIDGSILKGNQNSSIAILAKQYVCVNTTQFLAGATDWSQTPAGISGSSGPPSELTFASGEILTEHSLYGSTPSFNAGAAAPYSNEALYVSESAGGAPQTSMGDFQLSNYSGVQAQFSLGSLTSQTPVRDVSNPNTLVPIQPNVPFDLSFSKDVSAVGDWMLERAAILPGDIQIQAVLYAQDNSFFVIPGEWFNTDSTDTLNTASDRLDVNKQTLDARYPFYGQPIDLQITIDGAVSENIPANISDQSAWMQKWGWIPHYHGSDLNEVTPHLPAAQAGATAPAPTIGIGLNFTYDHLAGFPYVLNATDPVKYIRQDRFGRALPFAPSLPVSPDLLYSGDTQTN
jgi:hypothetical protein